MKIELGTLQLLPAKKGTCPDCAVVHAPEMPHNRDSMYYTVKFMMEHHRAPTWADAMAHCAPEVKARWRYELLDRGVPEDQLKERTDNGNDQMVEHDLP